MIWNCTPNLRPDLFCDTMKPVCTLCVCWNPAHCAIQHFLHERGIDMQFLKRFYQDEGGDMAEKAVVMAAIIIGAYATWRLLGNRISGLVSQVAGAI